MLPLIYRWIEKPDGVALWKRERCVASVRRDRVTINVPKGPTLELLCCSIVDGRAIAAAWWNAFDLPAGQRPVYPWEQAKRRTRLAARPPAPRLLRCRTPDPRVILLTPLDDLPIDSEPTTIGAWERSDP
jgi:hypothetical protein